MTAVLYNQVVTTLRLVLLLWKSLFPPLVRPAMVLRIPAASAFLIRLSSSKARVLPNLERFVLVHMHDHLVV